MTTTELFEELIYDAKESLAHAENALSEGAPAKADIFVRIADSYQRLAALFTE